jgi:hypothetical protein
MDMGIIARIIVWERLGRGRTSFQVSRIIVAALLIGSLCSWVSALGQTSTPVNVVTEHNDIGRTGQNLNETLLTPQNVNPAQFGKLFTQSTFFNGQVFAQPLYVANVAIPGKGTHNVIYAVTGSDYVYAYDADSNGGINAKPLWSLSLLTNSTPAGTYSSRLGTGIHGTPVIDLSTNTMYLVSSELQGTPTIFRLHALDITTGAEKFGGPYLVQATVPGTGTGSSGGSLTFNATYEFQRPGLLLLNGVLYVAYGSVNDNGPWHGWIFSYNASTLKPIDVLAINPNGSAGGIWIGGAGLAAEVNDPNKPYGRMFTVTGNGSFSATPPYTNTMNFGMSVITIDLTNGKMTVTDAFTPYNEATLETQDGDVGAGGVVLLPPQAIGGGKVLNPLVQDGKSGDIYILDRNNLGGYNPGGDKVVQSVQTPVSGTQNWGAGIWGSPAYWNNNLYFGGTNPGASNSMIAYSFVNGVMSTTPTSQTQEKFAYPGPTPSVSSNGTKNGIVWAIDASGKTGLGGIDVLLAYDATNISKTLYSSNTNVARDNPGGTVSFSMPTISNGKVYVGAANQLDVYGLLNSVPTAAVPVITPGSKNFTGSQIVTITEATPGAQILYTTDGSTPNGYSHVYSGPITVTSTEVITAIGSATGYLLSAPASATFTSMTNTVNPVFSLAAGTYAGPQTLTITDASAGAQIYYTLNGSTPSTSSLKYTGAITVAANETVQAIAAAPGLLPSAVVGAAYVITPLYDISFTNGFSQAQSSGLIQFNGSTDLDDFRLQLTNGGPNEAGSAFYTKPVNVQKFTTDFTFQLSNAVADGITFTIQGVGPTALGVNGAGLGYWQIPKSVAIKFDLYDNQGEGPNSSGLFTNGTMPTIPAIDLTSSGINLHDGNYQSVHITYDGTTLIVTLTDQVTYATWSHAFTVNIPAIVGGSTAYVGFTGGAGAKSASQKLTYWTYLAGAPATPNQPTGFTAGSVVLNGPATIAGSALQLTGNTQQEATSAYFPTLLDISAFATDFDFQILNGGTDGFTFVIQDQSITAVGSPGGGLGYGVQPNGTLGSIGNSVAIKFDTHNNLGEGNDSTGVYQNGASPTIPSINLSSSRIQLNSGDVIHAHIVYTGTVLTWTLSDVTNPSNSSVTNSTTINIPSIIGSNSAFVGFTGGTGGATAIQNILDWTFTNP